MDTKLKRQIRKWKRTVDLVWEFLDKEKEKLEKAKFYITLKLPDGSVYAVDKVAMFCDNLDDARRQVKKLRKSVMKYPAGGAYSAKPDWAIFLGKNDTVPLVKSKNWK